MMRILKVSFVALVLIIGVFSTPSINAKSESDEWMVGGEMATTWLWPNLFSGIRRDLCCVDSNPDNACNLKSQSDVQMCRAGRDNEAFIFVFRK
ncbi:hypothetical protein [Roseivirga sp.]|uniref:hypothetical protein n=1 Tax=Roseivirga sp. TaxID=1964215 RepID=UPI003B8C51D3